MTSNATLHAWIAESKQNRRYLKGLVIALSAIALVALAIDTRAGLMVGFVTAVIGVAGFWILGSHIADWEGQLALRRARARAAQSL